ncbi:hypothetical protein BJ742DRAFT_394458 [Cladochytrium replicatum]|nr:hypothetical protein BJ742DRAFT_394458 [Cladochytrium replicatum]
MLISWLRQATLLMFRTWLLLFSDTRFYLPRKNFPCQLTRRFCYTHRLMPHNSNAILRRSRQIGHSEKSLSVLVPRALQVAPPKPWSPRELYRKQWKGKCDSGRRTQLTGLTNESTPILKCQSIYLCLFFYQLYYCFMWIIILRFMFLQCVSAPTAIFIAGLFCPCSMMDIGS